MDLTTIDVSHIENLKTTDLAEIFGKNISVDYLAAQGGPIPYNIFTCMVIWCTFIQYAVSFA